MDFHGEGNGTLLQYPCLENPMDRGAWWAAVPGVVKSLTRLSDFTFTFHFHTLENEMATHSSILAWRIPGTGSLVGCRLWGRTESDTTEVTQQQQQQQRTSLVAQTVKHLCTMWETRVRSLGREDPLEKDMATHSSILTWKIPWMDEPYRLQSLGSL